MLAKEAHRHANPTRLSSGVVAPTAQCTFASYHTLPSTLRLRPLYEAVVSASLLPNTKLTTNCRSSGAPVHRVHRAHRYLATQLMQVPKRRALLVC